MGDKHTHATSDNTSKQVENNSTNSIKRTLSGFPENFLSERKGRPGISLCNQYGVQPKLKIGAVNDKYELEADAPCDSS